MRDFLKMFVIGVVLGGVMYTAREYAVSLAATNVADAAVDTVLPPQRAYEQLEIEIPQPEPAPEAVQAPATDFSKQARQIRVLAYSTGLLAEAMSNATSSYTPGAAFCKSFLKQWGVQMQIAVLADADLLARDPAQAFVQGFMIGL